jgi:hypothetical protein
VKPASYEGMSLAALMVFTQQALAGSQTELGEIVSVSRRTVWRWQTGKSHPDPKDLEKFARLAFPKDHALAAALAASFGATLESLGLVKPSPPAPLPPAKAPAEKDEATKRLLVDAVVCAAAEALDVSPRAVRHALHVAFGRARDAGLTTDTVAAVLAPPADARRATARRGVRQGEKETRSG